MNEDEPTDGIRFDVESGSWVARYTILTAGRTQEEAQAALAAAVHTLARTWPRCAPKEHEYDLAVKCRTCGFVIGFDTRLTDADIQRAYELIRQGILPSE